MARVCIYCGRIREAQGILGESPPKETPFAPRKWVCRSPCEVFREWRRMELGRPRSPKFEELHGKQALTLAATLLEDALTQLQGIVLPDVISRIELSRFLLKRAEELADVPALRRYAHERRAPVGEIPKLHEVREPVQAEADPISGRRLRQVR